MPCFRRPKNIISAGRRIRNKNIPTSKDRVEGFISSKFNSSSLLFCCSLKSKLPKGCEEAEVKFATPGSSSMKTILPFQSFVQFEISADLFPESKERNDVARF